MTLDERQREITIKSKKGTSPGFQVSELLEANTITMQYNTLKYKYTYKYNTIIRMKIKERKCIKKQSEKSQKGTGFRVSEQVEANTNREQLSRQRRSQREIHKNVKVDP